MDLETVTEELDLGKLVALPKKIDGGLLHKMYQVKTTTGEYAVKVLNPEIMKRPEALCNMRMAEKIGSCLKDKIPVVSALLIQGKQIHKLGGNYYTVYPWRRGMSIFYPFIQEAHCTAIGDILGKIHSSELVLPEISGKQVECVEYDWDGLLQTAKANEHFHSIWIEKFELAIKDIQKWNRMACTASSVLSEHMVISHRDLDPKNVLWEDGKPYLIDWESAGYVNPYQEFLEVVNYWADDGKGGLEYGLLHALYVSYSHYINMDEVLWDDVFAGSFSGMLGWLAYNMERALGIKSSCAAEQELGTEQVLQTIESLYAYENKIALLRKWIVKEHGTRPDKVVFLDIDGVLNSDFWNHNHQKEIEDGTLIDVEKVKILSHLIRESKAGIVLHSGWKYWFDANLKPLRMEAEKLQFLMKKEEMFITEVTPDHTTEEIRRTKKFSMVKAGEILAWLDQHPDVRKWVVIDDLDLHDPEVEKHQIRTDPGVGLTMEDVKRAVIMLCEPVFPMRQEELY